MKITLTILLLLFAVSSCTTEKLDLVKIENDDIIIEKYEISLITSSHDYVDLTDKFSNETTTIYKANSDLLVDVVVQNDTIFLHTKYDDMHYYELVAVKYGYTIKVVPQRIINK